MGNDSLIAELEKLTLVEVRRKLSSGIWGQVDSPLYTKVFAWVKLETESRSEARAEESIAIARNALGNSRRATVIAILAALLSAVMAILKVIEWFSK